MFDYDVVIIGGGPAGLTAGIYLGRAKRRVVLLEKEGFGGPMMNWELIENYPGFAGGISGAQLASEMIDQATKYELKLELAEVSRIDNYASSRWVQCTGGKGHTTSVVIIAGGARHKKLGASGEEELQGKGIFHCAFCDGGQFAGQVVAVCGGGDAGITEALYMTRLASRVIVVEAMPALTASAVLQERAMANPKLDIRTGVTVEAVIGDNKVEGLQILDTKGQRNTLAVNGVLVHVGLEPNTDYLNGLVPVDSQGWLKVNENMETEIPYILAAGDIRSGSPRQVITAAADGATAALSAERLLQKLG